MESLKSTILTVVLIVVMAFQNVNAQTEPLGGKPAPGSKPSVSDLDYQVKYQRAFEAVLWSMPAVAIYGFHRASVELGAGPNVILAYSEPAKPNSELLTANNQVPYILSQTDLRKGPVVLEVPAASETASLYGQVVDHWQITIAGVGPSGVDQGKGGKILLTPPGYDEPVSDEYIEIKSPSYRVAFAFRSVPGPNSSTAQAYEYAQTLKMYYYSELPNPKPTQYLFALADENGDELQANKTYSFTMPAEVPVEQFWSLVIYDLEVFAFIYNPLERAGLSSFDLPSMQKNSDGSVTLYFGPQPPDGLESNWIPTEGKRPLPVVRFYGGTEEFWNKSWEMPDVESY